MNDSILQTSPRCSHHAAIFLIGVLTDIIYYYIIRISRFFLIQALD